MVSATLKALAKNAGMPDSVMKYCLFTLNIYSDRGASILANPARDGVYTLALREGISSKVGAGESAWNDFLRLCADNIKPLQGIASKLRTYFDDVTDKRTPARHHQIYYAMDFFVQESCRRRRDKLRNPNVVETGHRRGKKRARADSPAGKLHRYILALRRLNS